ncbi:MAG: phage Gp37/Gp68 family protein [Cyanobacteria bacterium QH_7_48_89]|nr:MAG: phage Gp37/Gp68 family protein [Cyanobacteria bacterium QH_7_48_89]
MSQIEWTNDTCNPLVGCSRVSPGCANCYAATQAKSARLQQFEQYQEIKDWDGTVQFVSSALDKPRKRKKPTMYFVCSMSDLFHKNVLKSWQDYIFDVMESLPRHTFQLLTKRPERMRDYLSDRWRDCEPPSNIWLGTSVENKSFKGRIDLLRQTPAAVKFLSCEPLLEDLGILDLTGIGWVIISGESGSGARPCRVAWIESLIEQYQRAGVPVFVKQLGKSTDVPISDSKGGKIEEFPVSLQIRQFPVREREVLKLF